MSRTDKDLPLWFTEWWEPEHHLCPYDHRGPWARYQERRQRCDLPADPDISQYRHLRARRRSLKRTEPCCLWVPVYSSLRYMVYWGPRRWDRHFEWYGPARAKMRDWTLEQRKLYRANAEPDPLEPRRSHRHNPRNGWWW